MTMHNFISEDDIEQAIIARLKQNPFEYDIILCDSSPDKRDDINDGTGRTSKKQCILPVVLANNQNSRTTTITTTHQPATLGR